MHEKLPNAILPTSVGLRPYLKNNNNKKLLKKNNNDNNNKKDKPLISNCFLKVNFIVLHVETTFIVT